jgi:hypothetical protein
MTARLSRRIARFNGHAGLPDDSRKMNAAQAK